MVLEELLHTLEKKFGEHVLFDLSVHEPLEVEVISTGLVQLDRITGIGGIPVGAITEIYAPFGAGKTTLCYSIVASAQREGLRVCYFDSEQSFSDTYAKRCGVFVERLLLSQHTCTEDVFDIILELVRSEKINLIILDSLAALAPRTELEGDVGIPPVGLQARIVSTACRILGGALARFGVALVITNQMRMRIGAWGSPWTTPGGMAIKHHAALRIELRQKTTLRKMQEQIGLVITASIRKNKLAAPFKSTDLYLITGEGFKREVSLANAALETGVLTRKGSYYYFGAEQIAQGELNLWKELEDEQLFKRILAAVNNASA